MVAREAACATMVCDQRRDGPRPNCGVSPQRQLCHSPCGTRSIARPASRQPLEDGVERSLIALPGKRSCRRLSDLGVHVPESQPQGHDHRRAVIDLAAEHHGGLRPLRGIGVLKASEPFVRGVGHVRWSPARPSRFARRLTSTASRRHLEFFPRTLLPALCRLPKPARPQPPRRMSRIPRATPGLISLWRGSRMSLDNLLQRGQVAKPGRCHDDVLLVRSDQAPVLVIDGGGVREDLQGRVAVEGEANVTGAHCGTGDDDPRSGPHVPMEQPQQLVSACHRRFIRVKPRGRHAVRRVPHVSVADDDLP